MIFELRRHDVRLDPRLQRRKRPSGCANLVGQGRQAQIDVLTGVALGLPVQRLMLTELLEQ